MNKGRFYDEMDIQAVESKLNDVTVTAIPMANVASKQQYGHHHSNSNSSSHYGSSKSNKNQNNQYLTYQQNQLIQSAIQLVQQQQQLQQHQQQQQQQQRQRQQQEREREREREILENANLNRLVSATPPASQLYSSYGQSNNGLGLSQSSTSQGSGLSKYAQLLAVIEEMNRDIRPTYAMGRGDRLKRLIIQAKVLVRECLMETERSARQ
ncbi:probable serine/threonine-protein kinase yakA [Contarinia nasturtii]|uniref:probable serine/threonine-protein kinase yakA n=1 Tax=Contarinia nasturtii TaxID=265458 RepID=UPI0012D4B819|nr:probable serine/threonine-protein kinase yakA [Contarinia nasturtii]